MFAKASAIIYLFFFEKKKAVKNWKENKFQKSLAQLWKQSIDEQLCQVWALSSCPFLRSILEKEWRT